MEKIEIGYSPIGNTGNQAHHKFIFYTRADGTSFQIHGRGSRDDGLSPFDELASSGPNDLAGFGHLTVRMFRSTEKLHRQALQKPRELVFEGEDLARTFFGMAGMAQGIAEQKTKYNALSNNSNTLVDRVVQWSGGACASAWKQVPVSGERTCSRVQAGVLCEDAPRIVGKGDLHQTQRCC